MIAKLLFLHDTKDLEFNELREHFKAKLPDDKTKRAAMKANKYCTQLPPNCPVIADWNEVNPMDDHKEEGIDRMFAAYAEQECRRTR